MAKTTFEGLDRNGASSSTHPDEGDLEDAQSFAKGVYDVQYTG